LADVVEVKKGSRSTAHWSNDFIRLNRWLRNSFAQLITPLDTDSIGQNWEDSNTIQYSDRNLLCYPGYLGRVPKNWSTQIRIMTVYQRRLPGTHLALLAAVGVFVIPRQGPPPLKARTAPPPPVHSQTAPHSPHQAL